MKRMLTLFLSLIFFISSIPFAAQAVPLFVPAIHQRRGSYPASFKCQQYEGELFTLAYADQVNLSQEEAGALLTLIQKEVDIIINRLPLEHLHRPVIYIVVETINGGSYAVENNMYCTVQDIESGSYLPALIAALLNTREPWIISGALSYIDSEAFYDIAIFSYLQQQGNTDIFNLLGTRFYPAFNSPQELEASRYLAAHLFSYTIKKLGFQALLAPLDDSHWESWLDVLGFDYAPNHWMKDRFAYAWNKDFDMIVKGESSNYYLFSEEGGITTASHAEKMISRNQEGKEFLLDYIKQSADLCYYTKLKNNLNSAIDYYLLGSNNSSPSHTQIDERKIYIHYAGHHLHETVHIMLDESNHIWLSEALCDYFSEILYPSSYTKENVLASLHQPGIKSSWAAGKELYLQAGGNITTECFDIALYMDALAYLSFTEPEKLDSLENFTMSIGEKYIALSGSRALDHLEQQEGMELTYGQAVCFAKYLDEEYGLTTLLNYYYSSASIEEYFPIPYEELKQQWLELLREKFETS